MLTLAQEGISVAPGAPTGAAPAGAPTGAPAGAGASGAGTGQAAGAGSPPPAKPGGFDGMSLIFIMVIGMIIFMMWSGSRREKKKAEETMNALKKGARVTTVGGLRAVVVEVRDDEVVLESSGNRLTFVKTAIQTVLPDETPAAS